LDKEEAAAAARAAGAWDREDTVSALRVELGFPTKGVCLVIKGPARNAVKK